MYRAIELSKRGHGYVSPNPMVGCVIATNESIIGEGYHRKYGEAHAEVSAIHSVINQEILKKSTLYVTLEPCCHYGKTAPCVDLIIEKEIPEVVVGHLDPNPRVSGKGIEKLQKNGIDVIVGVLENEARNANQRFLTYHEKKRPYVILKWAETSDGFMAREDGSSKWISNDSSRQLVHKWRSEEDAILVGKNTALKDNPALNVRLWSGKQPVRVLLDAKLSVPPTYQLFDQSLPTIVFNDKISNTSHNITRVKKNPKNLRGVLTYLFDCEIQSMIVEGGSQILNNFISNNLWDEARIFKTHKVFSKGIRTPQIEYNNSIMYKEVINDQLIIVRRG